MYFLFEEFALTEDWITINSYNCFLYRWYSDPPAAPVPGEPAGSGTPTKGTGNGRLGHLFNLFREAQGHCFYVWTQCLR